MTNIPNDGTKVPMTTGTSSSSAMTLWALFTHWTTTACGTGGSMQQNLSALPNPILNEENHDNLYDKW